MGPVGVKENRSQKKRGFIEGRGGSSPVMTWPSYLPVKNSFNLAGGGDGEKIGETRREKKKLFYTPMTRYSSSERSSHKKVTPAGKERPRKGKGKKNVQTAKTQGGEERKLLCALPKRRTEVNDS